IRSRSLRRCDVVSGRRSAKRGRKNRRVGSKCLRSNGRIIGMIGRLNHVAIAVRELEKAARIYRGTPGADVSAPVALPEHGVITVFVTLPNTKIELIAPLGADSPIEKFLERNPDGGMHHICYEVDDIRRARDRLTAAGARVLGDGEPKIGAHGKPVIFL